MKALKRIERIVPVEDAAQPEPWIEVRPIGTGDRDFDIAFWQAQGPNAIFQAAWELVEFAHKAKGGHPDELRLQRTPVVVRKA